MLWIFMAVAMYRCTSLMEAGMIERITSGELAEVQTPGMMLLITVSWLIPLIMAFLSVTLEDSANRWASMGLGVVFTLFNIYHLTIHSGEPTVYGILIVAATVVVTALIAWYAWKWPVQEQ